MMLEEPYRWVETVANRREYLEDQLRNGSPAVGIPYDDGALLLTFGRGQRKLFEVYDRVAFAAMGHPADIERLRIATIDIAHVEGFTNSVADVSLRRLVNFGIAPLIKNAFDEIFRAPYIIRLLMAEIGGSEACRFFTIDCDGTFENLDGSGIIAGTENAAAAMRAYLESSELDKNGLAEVMDVALRTWAVGRKWALLEEEGREIPESPQIDEGEVQEIIRNETRARDPEVAILTRSSKSKNKFRLLSSEEIRSGLSKYL